MRIWIDTEFNEYHGALISMALVAEDGREWYGVRFCDDPGWWVREHVMPKLQQQPERDADLRAGLDDFIKQFDSVHIISDWPGDIAHFCNFLEYAPGDRIGPDTMTFEVRRDLPDTATTSTIPHNALADARALAKAGMSSAKRPIDVTVRPVAQVPVHPRNGRLWQNVREIDAQTDVPSYPLDDLYDKVAIDELYAEVERLRDALQKIGTECENYRTPATCWTSGRTLGANEACAHCIAARALAPTR